jgi:hypothetical protein
MARANICCTEASVVKIIWFFLISLREMKFLDVSAKLLKTITSFYKFVVCRKIQNMYFTLKAFLTKILVFV